jgi:MFS family permease
VPLTPASHATRARRALAIAGVTLAVQNGLVMAFAVLYLPLVEEFGASRAEVASVQSAVLLAGGASGPVVGWAFDRLGPRRLIQLGALATALAFAVAASVSSLSTLVAVYGVLAGLGLSTFGSQPNMALAALWYPGARGRAIAVADLGTGLGAFLFIPLAQFLVSAHGWRTTLLTWAGLLIVVVFPLNALQGRPPEPPAASGQRRGPAARPGWTLREALTSAPFWWLVGTRLLAGCTFPLMNTHLVAYAVGRGVDPTTAATALGSVSLVSLVGRLATGWLSDRAGRAPALSLAYLSATLGIGCLALLAPTSWLGWLALYVAFYGLAQGSSGIVVSARAADVFAGASFGAIYGWLILAGGPGEALGAWIGGRIFDATGSYLPAFGVAVAALWIGVLAIRRVGPDAHRCP